MTAGKIIRKTRQESRVFNYDPNNLSMEECERIYQEDLASGNPIFTEDQVSVISSIMNDLRQEFDDKLASAMQEFEPNWTAFASRSTCARRWRTHAASCR
jgi:hypothetical protein